MRYDDLLGMTDIEAAPGMMKNHRLHLFYRYDQDYFTGRKWPEEIPKAVK